MKHVLITDWHTNRNSPCRREFKELLMEAVDEGLSILGELAKQAVYSCLEKDFEIKKQDIPNNIEGFTNAIEEILGPGAKLLQIQMMKRLYEIVRRDFEYFPEKGELLFIKYVTAVEASYMQTQTQRLPAPLRVF